MDLKLTGKSAWVTGGGGGIGSAIAAALAAEGVDVALTGRTASTLEDKAGAIRTASGRRAIAVPADVTDTAAVQAAAKQVAAQFGTIDIVVNSAAFPGGKANGPLETVDDKVLLADLDDKCVSCLRTAKAAVPYMRERGWGRLIHVSGLNARVGGNYSAGVRNLAMVQLSKSLSLELGRYGITSNVVHPAATHGSWWDKRITAIAADKGVPVEDAETEVASGYAIRRLLDPEEIAAVVAFLASPLSIAITGESIGTGGGMHTSITI